MTKLRMYCILPLSITGREDCVRAGRRKRESAGGWTRLLIRLRQKHCFEYVNMV